MKNYLPFLISFFWSILSIGQCPTFTSSDLNSLDCFSGNTSCDLCVGDQFELTVAGDGLPDGGCVEWYYDDASSFNPYNGQGTYIGCGAITSEDPCNVCMSVEAILSHAHGGENNEFVIFNSGGGFNTDDFEFDFDSNNNGSPPIPSDEDIGASTACPLQVPNVSLMGCPSATPVAAGTDIPQNALVVLFVNNSVSFDYDFSALCATGAPIYIIQSSCDRLLGGFTNSPSTSRTQGIVNAGCGCDDYLTYTGSFSNQDGDYILGDGTLGNNGTSAPPISWSPVNPLVSSVDPVSFTIDASMCNGGPYFVKGIVDPLPGNCTQEFTQTLEFDVRCPEALITGDDEICVGQDAILNGSGGDDYDWSTGESSSSITVTPTSTMTYDLKVSIGNCEDDTDFTVDVLPLDNPTLSTHIICEDEVPYDLSNLVDPLYPTGDWSGTGVSFNEFDPDGLGGQTITVTFDSDEDCVEDATTTIEVTELELPILSTATLCESDPDLDLTTLADPNYPFGDWIGTGVTGEFFDPSGLGGQTISLEFVPDDDCVDIEFTDIIVNNGATPTLGTATLCESAAIYDLSALADPLYPTGTWSGTGVTTNQFNPNGLGGQTITLTFDSDADCVNDQTTTIVVTSGATPTLGTATLCESAAIYDLSALADPLYPTGTWSGTGVTTNQFNPNGLGGQTITLTFDSDADCVNDQTTTIDVESQITFSNLIVSCNTTNSMYVVSFVLNGGNSANYSLSLGSGNIVGNVFTSDSIVAGDPYQFIISDGSSCSPLNVEDTPNCGCSTNAGNLNASGSTPILFCENEMAMLSPVTNSFLDPNDVLNYVLYEGANLATANIIAISSVPEFSFMSGLMNLNTTYLIAAVAGDDDGSGNVNPLDLCFSFSNSIPIQFTAVPTASFQMDSFFVCDGGSAMVVINFTGTPPFQYQLSENGTAGNVETTMMSTVSLPFTNNIAIEILQIEDAICVGNITNSTAEVVVYPTLQITVLDTILNADDTYSIVLEIEGEDVSNYTFTKSAGTLNGQIFTTDPVPCDTQIEVCVEGIYCPQVCYQTVIACQSTNCISDAGTMDNMIQDICFGDTLNFSAAGELLDNNDLHCYVLHDNAGDVLGTTFSIYETEELFYTANLSFETPYYLSSVVGNNNGNDLVDFNDPCLSVSIGTPIVFHDLPTVSLPSDFTVCKDEFIDIPVMLTGNAPFTIVYEKENQIVPVGVITSQTNSTFQERFNQPAQIIITDVIDNFCSNENLDTINIDLFPDFSIEDFKIECEPGTQEYRVSFSVEGGLPGTFQVEGDMGTLTGNNFESQLFASSSNFNFMIFDGNNCDTIVRSGTFDCSCMTNAGTLEPLTDPILVCGDEQVSVVHNQDEVLDSDDILLFILHDNLGLNLSTVFDLNTDGVFEYNNAIVYGQTYYMSAIAGREVNGTIDFQDPCLSVSIGNPVIFQPAPSVNFSIQNEICEGDSVLIDLNFTGAPPFLTYYSIIENGMTSNRSFGSTDLNFQQLVQSPTGATQFEIRIDSIVSQGCSATASGSQIVSVLPPSRNLIEQSLCTGDSIIVDGTVYNEANPNDLLMLENGAMNGCDSIVEINLSFNSAIMVDFRETFCEGDVIEINGTEYSQTNPIGVEIIQTPGQCDSIFNIELQFDPVISLILSGGETICKGDTAYLEISLSGVPMIDFFIETSQGSSIPFTNIMDGDLLPVFPAETTSYNFLGVPDISSNCDILLSLTPVLIEVSDFNFDIELSDYQGFNIRCFEGEDGFIFINGPSGARPIDILWEDGSTDFDRKNLNAGDYKYVISDAAGCIDSMTLQLIAPDEIVPEFFAENANCNDAQEASLEITSIDGGADRFLIFINNESQGIVTSLPAIYSNLEDGTNEIRIMDTNGCLFEDSFDVSVGSGNPIVDLGQDTTIFSGDEIQLNASTNSIPDSVVWSSTTGLSCDTCLNPIVRPQADSRIQVTIYDENGCSGMDDILIKVLKTSSVYIPDAFSPNNDGINDFFTIFADSRATKINIFSIYDRWGNNVFQGTDLPINETTSGWDGKYRGKTLNSGVYIFFAEVEFLNGTVERFEGDVTLY